MAKKRPGWKPRGGLQVNKQNINKQGAPCLDSVIKQIRELEKSELTLKFSEMLRLVSPQLHKIVQKTDETPVKDLGIAKAIMKWLDTGDFRYIQPYIEYIFGKPKEIIEMKEQGKIILIMPQTEKDKNGI